MRKRDFNLYHLVVTGVAGVIFVGTFIITVDPDVQPPVGSGWPLTGVLVMFVTVVAWRLTVRRLRTIYWTRAGAETSLTPAGEGYRSIPIPLFTMVTDTWPTEGVREGSGPLTLPKFTGTVEGKSVRATLGRREYEPERENRSRDMYTVVEADLEADTQEGAIIAALGGETFDHGYAPFAVEDNADFVDEKRELAVAATSAELAEAVCSGHAAETLAECEQLEQVYAGDITAVYDVFDTESTTGAGREWETKSIILDAHGESTDIDASTAWMGGTDSVSHPVAGTIGDPEELEAQIQAVAAVASAFDDARRW